MYIYIWICKCICIHIYDHIYTGEGGEDPLRFNPIDDVIHVCIHIYNHIYTYIIIYIYTGEGGEDPLRFNPIDDVIEDGSSPTFPNLKELKNGDIATSRIKQVYICIFCYFYADSLMPLARLHFCVGLDFVTPLF
jgi:glutamate synthase domain-containing protein 2